MQVAIRKMGNSHGILIPKPILLETGLSGTAELVLNKGVIEIRPTKVNPRAGWADYSKRLAASGEDALVWPEFANEADAELVW
jgi:antitoxin MazE